MPNQIAPKEYSFSPQGVAQNSLSDGRKLYANGLIASGLWITAECSTSPTRLLPIKSTAQIALIIWWLGSINACVVTSEPLGFGIENLSWCPLPTISDVILFMCICCGPNGKTAETGAQGAGDDAAPGCDDDAEPKVCGWCQRRWRWGRSLS